jgi:type I restriction enzyme S subunit
MFDTEMITWSIDGGGHFFYRPSHKFSVTNVCGYMKTDPKRVDCKFLAAQLQLLHGRRSFNYQTKAHPSVIKDIYRVVLPDISEQRAIAEVLSDMDAEIEAWEKRLAKTEAVKTGMMQELLTGQTRLV